MFKMINSTCIEINIFKTLKFQPYEQEGIEPIPAKQQKL